MAESKESQLSNEYAARLSSPSQYARPGVLVRNVEESMKGSKFLQQGCHVHLWKTIRRWTCYRRPETVSAQSRYCVTTPYQVTDLWMESFPPIWTLSLAQYIVGSCCICSCEL